jgi:hypothetical protein
MEMAIGYKAIGMILLAGQVVGLSAFPVKHRHLHGNCSGDLEVSAAGVSYTGAKKHAWTWKLQDIRELKLAPDRVEVLTYHADNEFIGAVPVGQLYAALKGVMDQRLVMEAVEPADGAVWSAPVKRRGGADGALAFGSDAIVYTSGARDESRTWRYRDIDNISSTGPLELTITTFERAWEHYADRKDFHFELKQPISEAQYNEIWLLVEKKNGRIP